MSLLSAQEAAKICKENSSPEIKYNKYLISINDLIVQKSKNAESTCTWNLPDEITTNKQAIEFLEKNLIKNGYQAKYYRYEYDPNDFNDPSPPHFNISWMVK